jgi:hypothetical protein
MIKIHPHAIERLKERGATENEINITVESGEMFPAKFNRTGFRHNFDFNSFWNNKLYQNKQIEAYAVKEDNAWLVITIIVKYF